MRNVTVFCISIQGNFRRKIETDGFSHQDTNGPEMGMLTVFCILIQVTNFEIDLTVFCISIQSEKQTAAAA